MASKTAVAEGMERITVPRKYNGDNVMTMQVNGGARWQIKRGETVEVPTVIAQAIRDRLEAEEEVYRIMEAARR
jgi:hypothetical protein